MPQRPLPRAESDALVHDATAGMDRLLEIMARLRAPDGCQWDIEQTFATIANYTLEEAHEVVDAIEREAWDELKGELGDLLLQSVFHAKIAEEQGLFGFDDIVASISQKMVDRHPHIFTEDQADLTAEEQAVAWERMKAAERAAKKETRTLDGVAVALPALTRAVKLQKRAARVGFDWPTTHEVIDKIVEEARELEEARSTKTPEDVAEEFGDLLFVMANLARHLDVDPETALRAANAKFTRRFNRIEDWLAEQGRKPADSDLAEMDALWDRAKAEDKDRSLSRRPA
ncbi:MAG: nucleoside triphosphate pyrophosphohydrolase [Rhodobacteraceae bacterium GWF1_65_7]|nr:MAG: nucleoside triphosphate pyrophosphohydrolase [Rhodobacteraceae bacterium GWF1_65_7]